MTKRETYEQRTEALLLPILEENQFELVDVEYVKEGSNWYLRAYIDKPGGITINDCELVSRALSDRLDEEDYIDSAYILEVSSPGLGRPLKKDRDFQRSLGSEVEVRLFRPLDGSKELTGILKDYNKEKIEIETADGNRKKKIAVLYGEEDFVKAARRAEALRAEGFIASLFARPKKTGKFIDNLEKHGFDGFVILGEKDEVQLF